MELESSVEHIDDNTMEIVLSKQTTDNSQILSDMASSSFSTINHFVSSTPHHTKKSSPTKSLDETFNSSNNDEWLEASTKRIQRSDPDFSPTGETELLKLTFPNITCPTDENVYLVFEENLEKLVKYCMACGNLVSQVDKKSFQGTKVVYFMTCLSGCETRWDLQPKIGGTRGVGNLMVAAAGEMAGIPFPKLKRFAYLMNIPFIEKSTYYRLRGNYVFPEIQNAWSSHQLQLIQEIRKDNKLQLSIDGQCDSPGHNATYCTVSAMDVDTNKIVDYKIVDVKEVKNSQSMEKEGFIRTVDNLLDNHEVKINLISTDRHSMIRKLMATCPKYTNINHQFDPWHIAKGILKKLVQCSKKKGYEQLGQWAPAIINHLYWSICNCNGNGAELVERFLSVIHHVCNKHTFPGVHYTKCGHAPYTGEESKNIKWIKPGSPAHDVLLKILRQPQLVKDMHKMNANISTAGLEIFHSLKIRYLPKSIFFEKDKMLASTALAILDHNLNVDRKQAHYRKKNSEGKYVPKFRIRYSKATKRFTASKVKVEKSYRFMKTILKAAYFRAVDSEKRSQAELENRKRLS